MHTNRTLAPAGCLVVLLLAGCKPAATAPAVPPSPEAGPAAADLDGQPVRVSGPYAHKNLAVFLVHADGQDGRDFLTLDEGLAQGLVKVTEKAEARVGELE